MEFYLVAIYILGFFATNVHSRNRRETSAIIKGNLAAIGEIPYIVSINKYYQHVCGGGIIDEQFILTAAHCFVDEEDEFREGYYEILAGIIDVYDEQPLAVDVDKIYVHGQYNGSVEHEPQFDIAVIKLKDKLELNKDPKLQVLTLPRVQDTFEDKDAVISGFGYNKLDLSIKRDNKTPIENGETDGKLYTSPVKVLNTEQCQANYYPSIVESHLCGRMIKGKKERFYGVCSGDSGGPLVYRSKVIIGVLSASGDGCDESQDPGLYTRVSSYLQFIKDAKADKDSGMRTFSNGY